MFSLVNSNSSPILQPVYIRIRTTVTYSEDTGNRIDIDSLITREFGDKIYVDLEIGIDGDMKLKDAHDIAEGVHDLIEQKFHDVKHVMVHLNPKGYEYTIRG